MNSKSASFLRAVIEHFHPYDGQSLLRFLPASTQEMVKKGAIRSVDFSTFFSHSWLDDIHYSWFLDPLKQIPSTAQGMFFQLFSKEQQKKIQEKLPLPETPLSPFVQPLLFKNFKKRIFPQEILSVFELPPSDMNSLLELAKRQLVHLIDLLGIHDLAADLRQVVDKTFLQKIYSALSQEQLHFLHYCLKQPLKWVPPKLNITAWDGDKKTLNLILHQRGLIRLGKALSNENPSLQWHITHRLDTGRGAILAKVFAGKQDPALVSYFKSQVLHLVRRYQK